MLCQECRTSLLDQTKKVYVCNTCHPNFEQTGIAVYWCKGCKDTTEHEHKREKFRGVPGVREEEEGGDGAAVDDRKTYLDNLL